jgi:hypothetical protein
MYDVGVNLGIHDRSKSTMRVLTLILVLAVSAQPLQAGYCAMDLSQGQGADSGHHLDMDMSGDHSDSHGCCDPDSSDSGGSCQDGMHCRVCTAVTSLVPEGLKMMALDPSHPVFNLNGNSLLPSHSNPPYRPPIG